MNKYTISCTEKQTRKALELGAPIQKKTVSYTICPQPGSDYEEEFTKETDELIIPTAEEMIGWLEEQGQSIEVSRLYRNNPNWSAFVDDTQIVGKYYSTRKEAILAAINAALDYLEGRINEENE